VSVEASVTGDLPTGSQEGLPSQPAADGKFITYQVELDVFEGPLDLLLHLVKRHELDILDIPIAFITEKYLAYLGFMRAMDLEIAGDYLVMAATLAFLKSRELLPPTPDEEQDEADDDEVEDPREPLIRRLLEYERFRAAGVELYTRPISGRDVFARGAEIEVPEYDPGLAPVSLFRLAEAYNRVLSRAKIHKSHEVTLEPITVSQRMEQLTLMLRDHNEIGFEGLFLARTWQSEHELRSMLVVTLMSVLELVKLGLINVLQPDAAGEIKIFRRVTTDDAMRVIRGLGNNIGFGELPVPSGGKSGLDAPTNKPASERASEPNPPEDTAPEGKTDPEGLGEPSAKETTSEQAPASHLHNTTEGEA